MELGARDSVQLGVNVVVEEWEAVANCTERGWDVWLVMRTSVRMERTIAPLGMAVSSVCVVSVSVSGVCGSASKAMESRCVVLCCVVLCCVVLCCVVLCCDDHSPSHASRPCASFQWFSLPYYPA